MKLSWPPRPLGLGPLFNFVVLSREQRAGIGRRAWQSVAMGIAAALVVAVIDYCFFNGETARRTPPLDAHPTPAARVLVAFIGGLLEELYFRLVFATAVAALTWIVLGRLFRGRSVATAAQWVGTIAAMIYVALWHTGMVDDPSSDSRVIVVNAVGNLLYGWTFWRRGFELAALTHGTLNTTLYLGLPLLH
jgi:membrane protease YdiL (CAAX protease family)